MALALLLAQLLWVVQHVWTARRRAVFIARWGEQRYSMLRFALNLGWFGATTVMHALTRAGAPVALAAVAPAELVDGLRWSGLLILVLCLFSRPGPMDISVQRARGHQQRGAGPRVFERPAAEPTAPTPWGLVRITRHPMLLGVGLFVSSFLMVDVRTVDLAYWGPMLLLVVVGIPSQERRLGADPAYTRFFAETSLVPFAALATGRTAVPPNERRALLRALAKAVVLLGAIFLLGRALPPSVWFPLRDRNPEVPEGGFLVLGYAVYLVIADVVVMRSGARLRAL